MATHSLAWNSPGRLLIHRRVTPAELHHVILPGYTSSTGHSSIETLKGWWLSLHEHRDVVRCHEMSQTKALNKLSPCFKHVWVTLEKRSCPSLSTGTTDDCKALCRFQVAPPWVSYGPIRITTGASETHQFLVPLPPIQQGNTWNMDPPLFLHTSLRNEESR